MAVEDFQPIAGCDECAALKIQFNEAASGAARTRSALDEALTGTDRATVERLTEELKDFIIERHLAEVTIVRHLQDHDTPI